MEQQIISREEAREEGLKRFYTGVRCKHGHLDERLVSDKRCYKCDSIRCKRQREANPDRMKAWREANPNKVNAGMKAWREANPSKFKDTNKKWREANPNKQRAKNKKWREANPDKVNANLAKRRANKLQATPSWANHTVIRAFYTEAQRLKELTGEVHHVDHIVPLQGKLVCGLHVEGNLQVLLGSDNMSKSNTFDPNTFEG